MIRKDRRAPDDLRPLRIVRGIQAFAEGSAMITMGRTRVLCTVSVQDRVPGFLRGQNRGWITAEYAMLPRATPERTPRESATRKQSGRSQEIQRLIGRSLRAVTDMEALGARTLTVDCDVLQGDGGTRMAAVSGAYVALWDAMQTLGLTGEASPLTSPVAGVSVGIVDGELLLDLCYEEDSRAQVDFNVVMTSTGKLIEVQGTAEGKPFSLEEMVSILGLARRGIEKVLSAQENAVGEVETVPERPVPARGH